MRPTHSYHRQCTPSRSAWLSGRYYHNLRPGQSEAPRHGEGPQHYALLDTDAIFPTLHRNGYQTALFGKIHNNQAEWLCHPQNHTEPFTHIETECSPCGNYLKAFVVKSADAVHTMQTLGNDKESSHYSHAEYGNRSVAFIKEAAKSSNHFRVRRHHRPAPSSRACTVAPGYCRLSQHLCPRHSNFNMLASDHFDLLSTHPILTPDLVCARHWGEGGDRKLEGTLLQLLLPAVALPEAFYLTSIAIADIVLPGRRYRSPDEAAVGYFA